MEESYNKLGNQIYLFGKQHSKHYNLNGKVRVVITDSPIPIGCVYDSGNTEYLKEITLSEFNKFTNLNFFLKRKKDYNPNGRMQTYEEALHKDDEILSFMKENDISYVEVDACKENISLIVEQIKNIIFN